MPGIDSYTKLLLHCNGVDASTTFPDDSGNSKTVTANGNAQVDTGFKKLGTGSLQVVADGDYLSMVASDDFSFPGDFTIDLWLCLHTVTAQYKGIFQTNGTNGEFQLWIHSENYLYLYSNAYGGIIAQSAGLTWTQDQWYHIAVVRSGSSVVIYRDGVSVATGSTAVTLGTSTSVFAFGNIAIVPGYPLNGCMDEIRVSKGIARWTANFDVPTTEYTLDSEETISIPETINLSDTWNLQTNPDQLSLTEIIQITDTWNIATNPELLDISDTVNLSDSWLIQTNPDFLNISESIHLSDSLDLSITGTIVTQLQTKLYTILNNIKSYVTDLRTSFNSVKKYSTKLYTQLLTHEYYQTDLRVRVNPIDAIVPGTLEDFLVKLDGVTLTDVDYTTLTINLNLNTTPSNAQFILARRHDDLDKKMNGTTSIITVENKIEIYDGTFKLFTGYISELDADSTRDVVRVTASDCRLKMSRASMELKYGGIWQPDSNHNGIVDDDDTTSETAFNAPTYIRFQKNIGQAYLEVMAAVGSLVSGYDVLPFPGSFTPEYVKSERDYTSLIDELIRNTANCNWYIDANERLKFQKIGSGAIKSLPLASLSVQRHPYDLIIDDVRLNRPSTSYAQSLNVKRGKNIEQYYATRTFEGWINASFGEFLNSLRDKTSFVFHQRSSSSTPSERYYTGTNGLAITSYNSLEGGWLSYPIIIVQWLMRNITTNLSDITVGSGLPKKTLYLTSYGRKTSNLHYGEEVKVDTNPNDLPTNTPVPDKTYLVKIQDEIYDQTGFAADVANFELSQNNKMQTSATLSLLLDAYKYYGLSFSDLVNLSNTIQAGIYSNANGFPLNIDGIQINCATRVVTMNLSNSGKSWYVKSANILTGYTPPSVQYLQPKVIWRVVTSDGTVYTTE